MLECWFRLSLPLKQSKISHEKGKPRLSQDVAPLPLNYSNLFESVAQSLFVLMLKVAAVPWWQGMRGWAQKGGGGREGEKEGQGQSEPSRAAEQTPFLLRHYGVRLQNLKIESTDDPPKWPQLVCIPTKETIRMQFKMWRRDIWFGPQIRFKHINHDS